MRKCVGIREKSLADTRFLSEAVSGLGTSLSGQKKYSEAVPLLLSGYEGLKQREVNVREDCMRESLQRAAHFYEATGKPASAAEWKQKFDTFNDRASGHH